MRFTVRTGQDYKTRIRGYLLYNNCIYVKVWLIGLVLTICLLASLTFCEGGYGPFMALDEGLVRFIVNSTSSDTVVGFIGMDINVEGAVGAITATLKSYGCTIMSVLWISSLLTAYVNQQAYAEIIIKKILILGVSIFLIYYSDTICQYIADIGTDLATELATSITVENTNLANDIINAMHTACDGEAVVGDDEEMDDIDSIEADADGAGINVLKGFGRAIKGLFSSFLSGFRKKITVPLTFLVALLVPALATAVGYIMIMIACYSRGVEIAILKVLSPIPMSILANEPLGSGPAARFLKNLGALSIQGAVLIVIAAVCTTLVGNAVSNIATDLTAGGLMQNGIKAAAVAIAEGAMMMKSLSISQKVFGIG